MGKVFAIAHDQTARETFTFSRLAELGHEAAFYRAANIGEMLMDIHAHAREGHPVAIMTGQELQIYGADFDGNELAQQVSSLDVPTLTCIFGSRVHDGQYNYLSTPDHSIQTFCFDTTDPRDAVSRVVAEFDTFLTRGQHL